MTLGPEVGSVYVSVLPSARGFGTAAKRQIESQLASSVTPATTRSAEKASAAAGTRVGRSAGLSMQRALNDALGVKGADARQTERMFAGLTSQRNLITQRVREAAREVATIRRNEERSAAQSFRGILGMAGGTIGRIGTSLTQVTYGINGVTPALVGAGAAMTRFVSAAGAANPIIGGVVAGVGGAAIAFVGFQAAVGAATAAIVTFGVESAANLELVRTQIVGMLGEDVGKRYFDYVLQVAKTSIVETQALLAAGRTLIAFGVKDYETLKFFTDSINAFAASQNLSADKVQQVALAFGQVRALGRLAGQEVIQLANAGIGARDVLNMLPKYAKMGNEAYRKLQQEGRIPASDFFAAWELYQKRYVESAKKASGTLIGLWMQVKDALTINLGLSFEKSGAFAILKDAIRGVVDLINTIDFTPLVTAASSAVQSIANAFGLTNDDGTGLGGARYFFEVTLPNAIAQFGAFASGVIGNLRVIFSSLVQPLTVLFGAFDTVGGQAGALSSALKGVSATAAAFGYMLLALATGVRVAWSAITTFTDGLGTLGAVMQAVLTGNFAAIPDIIGKAQEALRAKWQDVISDTYTAGKNIGDALAGSFSAADFAAAGATAAGDFIAGFQNRTAGELGYMPGTQGQVPRFTRTPPKAKPNFGDSGKTVADDAKKTATAVKAAGNKVADAWLEAAKTIADAVKDFGSITKIEPRGLFALTTADVLYSMRVRVAKARAFFPLIVRLAKLGLNRTSLLEIIQAGPTAGTEIANALLAGGPAAIAEVNKLESELVGTARAIGGFGANTQYGVAGYGAGTAPVNVTVYVGNDKLDSYIDTRIAVNNRSQSQAKQRGSRTG